MILIVLFVCLFSLISYFSSHFLFLFRVSFDNFLFVLVSNLNFLVFLTFHHIFFLFFIFLFIIFVVLFSYFVFSYFLLFITFSFYLPFFFWLVSLFFISSSFPPFFSRFHSILFYFSLIFISNLFFLTSHFSFFSFPFHHFHCCISYSFSSLFLTLHATSLFIFRFPFYHFHGLIFPFHSLPYFFHISLHLTLYFPVFPSILSFMHCCPFTFSFFFISLTQLFLRRDAARGRIGW